MARKTYTFSDENGHDLALSETTKHNIMPVKLSDFNESPNQSMKHKPGVVGNFRTFRRKATNAAEHTQSEIQYDNGKSLEDQLSKKEEEVLHLKRLLNQAHLQMAEIVAESAITIHDLQRGGSESRKKLRASEDCSNPGGSGSTCNEDASTTIIESDEYRILLEEQLFDAKRQLSAFQTQVHDLTSEINKLAKDKEQVQLQLQMSIQIAEKLQDLLQKHKVVKKLEQMVYMNKISHLKSSIKSGKILRYLDGDVPGSKTVEFPLAHCTKRITEREVILKQNLRKSEYEVEVLDAENSGLREVLDQVACMLNHASASKCSTVEIKELLRRLVGQMREEDFN